MDAVADLGSEEGVNRQNVSKNCTEMKKIEPGGGRVQNLNMWIYWNEQELLSVTTVDNLQ